MAVSSFDLIGKAALANRLKDAVVDDDAAEMEKAAAELQREIQTRAPVATGRLRDSYQVDIKKKGGTIVGRVHTSVPYGVHQEYGTYKMAAQPHVRPALESQRESILNRFEATVSFE